MKNELPIDWMKFLKFIAKSQQPEEMYIFEQKIYIESLSKMHNIKCNIQCGL